MASCSIVSCAFREPYLSHSINQKKAITEDVEFIYYVDELPYKEGIVKENIVTRFQESLYGFKPHAIQKAIDLGYKKVIWLDPSVLPVTPIQVLIDRLDQHPLMVISGNFDVVRMTSQKALDWFGLTENELKDVKHLGGTVYCFNFNDPKIMEVFNLWKKAEEEGIFGTQDDFMRGHWADESCMALAIRKVGAEWIKIKDYDFINQKTIW